MCYVMLLILISKSRKGNKLDRWYLNSASDLVAMSAKGNLFHPGMVLGKNEYRYVSLEG